MSILEKIDGYLKEIATETKSVFTALYKGEQPLRVFSTFKDKERVISELTGLLVRKALISTSDIKENFNPEYLFSEGKDYGIFLYIVEGDIVVATIIDEKPNFSLLRLVHSNISKKLIPHLDEIKSLEIEESTENLEPALPVETKEEEIKTSDTAQSENVKQSVEELPEEIQELEKVFSEEVEKYEEKEIVEKEKQVEEKEEQLIENEEIPLENLLSKPEDKIENINEILEELRREFIKEIGPIGKILFNKKVKELKVEENPVKPKLKDLINQLAEEISVEERKDKFLKDAMRIIGG
jgi:hypothetical protein